MKKIKDSTLYKFIYELYGVTQIISRNLFEKTLFEREGIYEYTYSELSNDVTLLQEDTDNFIMAKKYIFSYMEENNLSKLIITV